MKRVDTGLATTVAFSSGAVVLALAIGLAVDIVPPLVVTGIAALWCVGAIIGIVDTVQTLTEVQEERRRAGYDEILIDIASANVRRECFRLLELIAIFVVGLIALAGVGQNPVLGRLLILYVVILLIANARLDRYERKGTDQLIRQARLKGQE